MISRLSSLGDVVCSLPVAVALKRSFPACRITWVVGPGFAAVVSRCEAVDETVERNSRLWPPVRLDSEFDVALDLQGLAKSAAVLAVAKAKVKLGYHWQREGSAIFSRRVLPDPTSLHIVDQYVDVARAAGAVADYAEFGLHPTDIDRAAASRLTEPAQNEPYVALNPGAGWATKRWPTDHCAKLIDLLASKGLNTVVIGGHGTDDRAVANQVLDASHSKPIDLVGKTGIGALMAVIEGGVAHIGGDTGSTHIAAALGRPAIGLYSITKPRRSCPYGQIDRCLYEPSGLADIEPERVLEKVLEARS